MTTDPSLSRCKEVPRGRQGARADRAYAGCAADEPAPPCAGDRRDRGAGVQADRAPDRARPSPRRRRRDRGGAERSSQRRDGCDRRPRARSLGAPRAPARRLARGGAPRSRRAVLRSWTSPTGSRLWPPDVVSQTQDSSDARRRVASPPYNDGPLGREGPAGFSRNAGTGRRRRPGIDGGPVPARPDQPRCRLPRARGGAGTHAGLGGGKPGSLPRAAIDETLRAVHRFFAGHVPSGRGPRVIAVATSAVRDAGNRERLLARSVRRGHRRASPECSRRSAAGRRRRLAEPLVSGR